MQPVDPLDEWVTEPFKATVRSVVRHLSNWVGPASAVLLAQTETKGIPCDRWVTRSRRELSVQLCATSALSWVPCFSADRNQGGSGVVVVLTQAERGERGMWQRQF